MAKPIQAGNAAVAAAVRAALLAEGGITAADYIEGSGGWLEIYGGGI